MKKKATEKGPRREREKKRKREREGERSATLARTKRKGVTVDYSVSKQTRAGPANAARRSAAWRGAPRCRRLTRTSL